MQVKLVVLKGGSKVREIKLRLPTIVGRGRNCSLQLPHPLVSRQHCEIFESDGKLIVRDLGSLNGTFLNEQKITECEVPAGSKLTIGVVSFRVEYAESSEPVAASTPLAASTPVAASASASPMAPTGPVPVVAAAMAVPAIGQPAAPMAVPLAAPLGTSVAAPMARPVTTGPAAQFSPAMAPFQTDGPGGPGGPAPESPRPIDVVDSTESTQSADDNRAVAETPCGPTVDFTSAEEFAADEPGEDHVEIVEDAASLLPPVALPLAPTLPAAPLPTFPSPPPTVANAVAANPAATKPAERPATADSEQDLLVFLKSLGK